MTRKEKREERAVRLLARKGLTLALAESCTGGLIGYRITSVPGSSAVFRGGVVAYADLAKSRLLGVDRATLRRRGAVSAETAVEMARGARRALGARVALAVTGIAGPAGGTPEKPVGLVFTGLSAGRKDRVEEHFLGGGREKVRRQAADLALSLLLSWLDDHE